MHAHQHEDSDMDANAGQHPDCFPDCYEATYRDGDRPAIVHADGCPNRSCDHVYRRPAVSDVRADVPAAGDGGATDDDTAAAGRGL
jgi:hypothetical protein